MVQNFDELVELARSKPRRTVVIATAHTPTAIEAAILAHKENLADCLLTGDAAFIKDWLANNAPEYTDAFEIEDTGTDLAAGAAKAVELVREGRGHIILKGKCDTGLMLKAVIDKEKGLRTGQVMSDVLAFEAPGKLVLMGDGGFLPLPDLKEKVSIIQNCVQVAHALGTANPRVALLTHTEQVNPKVQSTVDAAIIAKMNQRGQLKGCTVEGPLAFDNAVSPEAARMKGIDSPVGGHADILVVPNIEAGNIFGKTLTYYCNWRVAHVVMGAKAPILIASRADTAETKFHSMAMGVVSAS